MNYYMYIFNPFRCCLIKSKSPFLIWRASFYMICILGSHFDRSILTTSLRSSVVVNSVVPTHKCIPDCPRGHYSLVNTVQPTVNNVPLTQNEHIKGYWSYCCIFLKFLSAKLLAVLLVALHYYLRTLDCFITITNWNEHANAS